MKKQIMQNKAKIAIPLLFLSLALVFTFGTSDVSAAHWTHEETNTWFHDASVSNNEIFVNASSGNDSNNGFTWETAKLSILNAIGAVNDGGIVYLANGIYSGLNNTNITITKNITIIGQSELGTIIDAQFLAKIFTILPGVTVTLQDLTITNANSTGGAIDNLGNLIIKNVNFINNTGTAGGAINNTGNLTIIRSSFINNTATYGGAIY
ncbi:MAG: hypothetical protein ACXVHP_02920, partial [Methanobacterium sp.]